MAILGDAWTAVGGRVTLRRGEALISVFMARATIREAREARAESRQAHKKDLEEEQAATYATISELQRLAQTPVTAHQEEMAEHGQVLQAEALFQRALQLERISEVVLTVICAGG